MFSSNFNNLCRPCHYFSTLGNSVSRWCSHGCEQDHCACSQPLYAYLTQVDDLTVAANSAINFGGPNLLSDEFLFSNGFLELPVPGIYRVEYQLHIPAGAMVNTTVVVQVDGINIAGTQQTIVTSGIESARTVTGQAIFQISEPATLALVSSDAFSISTPGVGDVIATMSVVGLA